MPQTASSGYCSAGSPYTAQVTSATPSNMIGISEPGYAIANNRSAGPPTIIRCASASSRDPRADATDAVDDDAHGVPEQRTVRRRSGSGSTTRRAK